MHSRRDEWYSADDICNVRTEVKRKLIVQVLSILELLKLVRKNILNENKAEQVYYVYNGPNILGQEMEKLHGRLKIKYELKRPELSLIKEQVNPIEFLQYRSKSEEKISKNYSQNFSR